MLRNGSLLQFTPQHLPGRGYRKFLDNQDAVGDLVCRDPSAEELLQFVLGQVCTGTWYDARPHRFSGPQVRDAEHCGLLYPCMASEPLLNFLGQNIHPARDDQILLPADDLEIAVPIEDSKIACCEPAIVVDCL